jgi:hypothetical protein
MKQSDHFIENADNCAQLAERATDDQPTSVSNAWRQRGERSRENAQRHLKCPFAECCKPLSMVGDAACRPCYRPARFQPFIRARPQQRQQFGSDAGSPPEPSHPIGLVQDNRHPELQRSTRDE